MKRVTSLALLVVLLLTGCSAQTGPTNEELGWGKDWAPCWAWNPWTDSP